MKHSLEETAEGFKATLDTEDGHGVQVFEGKTEKEVIDKLLAAQANATVKINEQHQELKKHRKPDPAQSSVPIQRKPLTADERMTATSDLQDPTKAPEAVKKIIESELGAPLDTVRQRLTTQDENQAVEDGKAVATAWMQSHPQHFPSTHNSKVIINFLRNNNWAVTNNNLELAFEECMDAGLLQAPKAREEQPAEEEQQPGADSRPAEVTTRPRAASTGLRNRAASGAGPGSVSQGKKLTVAEIEVMPEAEYREKYQDPAFRKQVDDAYAEAAAKHRQKMTAS